MQAQTMSEEVAPGQGIDVAAVGRALGMLPEESKALAVFMRDEGWARVSVVADAPSWMELTYAGHCAIQEIRELRAHPVRRWARDHYMLYPVLVWVVLTAAAALVTKLVEMFF